jgi:hypothetical protein
MKIRAPNVPAVHYAKGHYAGAWYPGEQRIDLVARAERIDVNAMDGQACSELEVFRERSEVGREK